MEVSKTVSTLWKASSYFIDERSTPNVMAALQCLYTAVSFVNVPSTELKLHLAIGAILLKFTHNEMEARDQLQKAYQLSQNVSEM